jgi:hypothetical protein
LTEPNVPPRATGIPLDGLNERFYDLTPRDRNETAANPCAARYRRKETPMVNPTLYRDLVTAAQTPARLVSFIDALAGPRAATPGTSTPIAR